jgi:hypothetical protein
MSYGVQALLFITLPCLVFFFFLYRSGKNEEHTDD